MKLKLQWSEQFKKEYRALPQHIQKQTDRKLKLLCENLWHPSLRFKKMKGRTDELCEASVTMNYRMTFYIQGEACFLKHIGTHDILNRQ
jgi:mRNA-degrading endonuclease RelE of RelBE toxin-antitoxin system